MYNLSIMWIDLTLPLTNRLPIWPGTKQVEITTEYSSLISSTIKFNLHCGTHIDAPRHLFRDGKTVDEIPLSKLSGTAQVIEVQGKSINPDHINSLEADIALFKTKKEPSKQFCTNYCYLLPEAAESLLEKGVKMMGTDQWSIEKWDKIALGRSHKILLSHDIVIIESLNLKLVEEGVYDIMVIPLIIEAEASPVRVLAKPC